MADLEAIGGKISSWRGILTEFGDCVSEMWRLGILRVYYENGALGLGGASAENESGGS
jgi:hypothetical protein